MAKRTYNKGSAIYMAIAVVILIVLEITVFGVEPSVRRQPERQNQSTVIIETEQAAPGLVPEENPEENTGRIMPDFAPPMELETSAPLLPYGPEKPPENLPAWKRHAIPVTVPEGQPRIALIIDDMGMDRRHTREAIELPGPLTMAFLPYAENLEAQTKAARARGHELMVHVPMAPMTETEGVGPAVLAPEMAEADFLQMLDRHLNAFTEYVGINNHMGSKMTQDHPGMGRVMKVLRNRGLLFVDSRTIGTSVAAEEAGKAGVPFAVRDVFLDHDDSQESIVAALAEVERKARKHGIAIAIGHPRRETINALRDWIPTLENKGFSLVPVSAAVTIPEGDRTSP